MFVSGLQQELCSENSGSTPLKDASTRPMGTMKISRAKSTPLPTVQALIMLLSALMSVRSGRHRRTQVIGKIHGQERNHKHEL